MITDENRQRLDKAFNERLRDIDDIPDDQLAEYRQEIDQQAQQGDKDELFSDEWYDNSESESAYAFKDMDNEPDEALDVEGLYTE